MRYRRADATGGTYFFTVNLAERRSDILVRHIDDLRAAIKMVKEKHPFSILARVVLPEHLHARWRLPPGDADHPLRGSLIKAGFSLPVSRRQHQQIQHHHPTLEHRVSWPALGHVREHAVCG